MRFGQIVQFVMDYWKEADMAHVNIFIVMSPFQIVCANEARDRYCSGESNHLVVIDGGSHGDHAFRQKTAEIDSNWTKVTRIADVKDRRQWRFILRLLKTFSIIRKNGWRRGKAFVGDPKKNWFRFVAILLGTEVIWLDDGASSINLLKKNLGKSILQSPNATTPKFFTIFGNPKLEKVTLGAVVQNDMRYSVSKISNQSGSNGLIYFAGQWLSEMGVVSLKQELFTLQEAVDWLDPSRVIYIPHRHDSSLKLNEIAKICKVKALNCTLETYLGQEDQLPDAIVSWYSTALFTVKVLYPSIQLISIRVPLSSTQEKMHEEINNVYRNIKSLGIRVWPE